MNSKPLFLALCLASLTACAQPPVVNKTGAAPSPLAERSVGGLGERELYQFLLGEIAGQRGDLNLAAEAYADLARKLRDARVVKRAAEIAAYAQRGELTREMTQLLVTLEPGSIKARQLLISLLVGEGLLQDAKPQIEALLRMEGRPVADAFSQLHGLMARQKDKKAVYALVSELAAAHPSLPEARFAVAQAASAAGERDAALAALDEALRLKPDWDEVAQFKGQLLLRDGDDRALDYWRGFLGQYPGAVNVRLAYARTLARAGRYADARAQFELLRKDAPGNPETLLAIGLLAMQMNDLDVAESAFKETLDSGFSDPGQVKLYLGQLDENRQRYEAAMAWYRDIGHGGHQFEAALRVGLMLGKLGRVAEGRAHLATLKPDSAAAKIQLIQAEAQMLREAKDFEAAYAVLDRGLDAMPRVPELLYDRAMVAERLDRLVVLETDLRLLIELQPDNAHAYNALGYTLADRTDRIDEALKLLHQAIRLAPEDPFILDSLGWAQFKAKRYAEAVGNLKRAYATRPDPEIAAHLGEALWRSGEPEAARRIWEEAARAHPDNDYLRETMARFKP